MVSSSSSTTVAMLTTICQQSPLDIVAGNEGRRRLAFVIAILLAAFRLDRTSSYVIASRWPSPSDDVFRQRRLNSDDAISNSEGHHRMQNTPYKLPAELLRELLVRRQDYHYDVSRKPWDADVLRTRDRPQPTAVSSSSSRRSRPEPVQQLNENNEFSAGADVTMLEYADNVEYYSVVDRKVDFVDVKLVPVRQFLEGMKRATSYRDVIRLFLRRTNSLSDDDVDDLIASYVTSYRAGDDSGKETAGAFNTISRVGVSAAFKSTDSSENDSGELDSEDRLVDLDRAFQHYKEQRLSGLSKCHLPVPETLQISDLVGLVNRDYLPKCTILHRCRQGNCDCDDGMQCSVKTSSEITIYVMEIQLSVINDQTVAYRPWPAVRALNVTNHTECECKPSIHQAELQCLRCPAPFESVASSSINDVHTSCPGCKCTVENCFEVARGSAPLEKREIECLKQAECQPPACNFGKFNVVTGYCPCNEGDDVCICTQNEADPRCTSSNGSGEIDKMDSLS